MHLHLRHRPARQGPAVRVDPATGSASLRALIDELNGTVESLWWDMRWACTQLALTRGEARAHCGDDRPPAPHVPAPDADQVVLRGVVDELNSTAEALWWEIQWARAELAAGTPAELRLGRGTRYG